MKHSPKSSSRNHPAFFKRKLNIFLIIGLLLSTSTLGFGQDPIQLMNSQLRLLFSNIDNPNSNVRFLYDMSAKVTDEKFYTHISYDTSNVDNWYNIYSEMYHAAYDTLQFLNADAIFQQSFPLVQNDTIPIGIIDWNYNYLKDDALTTGNYFIFDTINDLLFDKIPRASSPFEINSLFTASPLTREVFYANVTFKISPQFLFTDPTTIWGPDSRRLEVDFGDGNGSIPFDISIENTHQVIYPSSGFKLIKTKIISPSGDIIGHSTSILKVLSDEITIPPDEVITGITGLDIGIYNNNCNPNMMKKYVIYLEGMDFLNDRSVETIYNEKIKDDKLIQLKNFGYTFVIVSWQDPYDKIQNNAKRVVQLIDYLKCQTDSVAPFVVIGESMGGLVGRYALSYMESSEYEQGKEDLTCKKALKHHTRLFITYDSPHQGANIPLGVQQLYKNIGGSLAYLFSPFANGITDIYNTKFLNGPSAKQMLIYHTETESNPLLLINTSTYGPSSLRTQFLNDIAQLKDYPQFCKMVAVSNGALNGAKQIREWDRTERIANDIMMKMESDFYLRVLGIKFVGSYFDLKVLTNPNGNGDLLSINKGISHWKIKLKWFGVKIVWDHTNLIKLKKSAKEVLPYCVNSGSVLGINAPFTTPSSGSNSWEQVLGLVYDYEIDGAGSIHASGSLFSLLMPWMININADLKAYTDGFGFGFIPVQSSFDYHADDPSELDYDIYADPVDEIMNKTVFDVVITNPSDKSENHMNVPKPKLQSYKTCLPHNISSYLIPREIGDDSLYLENIRTLSAGYILEAEKYIGVNLRNPYYNYPFLNSNINGFRKHEKEDYIISKDNPVIITGSAIVIRANDNVEINPFDPLVGPYSIKPGNMTLCCEDFQQRSSAVGILNNNQGQSSYLELSPNPVTNGILDIKYQFSDNFPVELLIYNIQGELIKKLEMPFADNSIESHFKINLTTNQLFSGTYILQLKSAKETLFQKFIVIK